MNGIAKRIVEPVEAAYEKHLPHGGAGDSGTLWRYIVDFVLPVLALAAMSALTAVMLVLVVSAVADMELSVQGGQASPDLWQTACFGPAFTWDGRTYPNDPPGMDMPGVDEPWLNRQGADRLDVLARHMPE